MLTNISMVKYKTPVSLVSYQWRYCSFCTKLSIWPWMFHDSRKSIALWDEKGWNRDDTSVNIGSNRSYTFLIGYLYLVTGISPFCHVSPFTYVHIFPVYYVLLNNPQRISLGKYTLPNGKWSTLQTIHLRCKKTSCTNGVTNNLLYQGSIRVFLR